MNIQSENSGVASDLRENLPRRVLHIASHNINIGDGALISSIQNYLALISSSRIQYDNLDILNFSPPYGHLSLDSIEFSPYDLVLVGGGGTIDGHKTRVNGMVFPLTGNQLRTFPTSLAFVALGYNLFPGEELHGRDQLINLLNVCAEKDIPFSVRNDGSLERLHEEVVTAAAHVVEIPDPGFFVNCEKTCSVVKDDGRPRVLIQLAGDKLDKRLGRQTQSTWNRFVRKTASDPIEAFTDAITRVIEWLANSYEAEITLAPHITTDLSIVAEVCKRLPTPIERRQVHVLGITHPRNAGRFFAAYSDADLVIGMRGHSVICAVGLRVPCIAICTHSKISGFMEKCGLAPWAIPATGGLEEHLYQLCSELLSSPDTYLAKRDAGTRDFESRYVAFLERCWRTVGPNR